ncbi:MAG: nitrilase-related carbon-nitrogen hydrolase, partial [Bdellovibrio sp.]
LLPFVSNFGRGQGPEVMTWQFKGEEIHWGGQVCYEGLDPAFSRGLAEKGADILVNVTNDSWFGRPSEPLQHLYMTLARAIETRRPLVRSTNTGISTVALASGEVLSASPVHEEWSGSFLVRYKSQAPRTFYVQAGHYDWILILVALFSIVGVAYARSRRS